MKQGGHQREHFPRSNFAKLIGLHFRAVPLRQRHLARFPQTASHQVQTRLEHWHTAQKHVLQRGRVHLFPKFCSMVPDPCESPNARMSLRSKRPAHRPGKLPWMNILELWRKCGRESFPVRNHSVKCSKFSIPQDLKTSRNDVHPCITAMLVTLIELHWIMDPLGGGVSKGV